MPTWSRKRNCQVSSLLKNWPNLRCHPSSHRDPWPRWSINRAWAVRCSISRSPARSRLTLSARSRRPVSSSQTIRRIKPWVGCKRRPRGNEVPQNARIAKTVLVRRNLESPLVSMSPRSSHSRAPSASKPFWKRSHRSSRLSRSWSNQRCPWEAKPWWVRRSVALSTRSNLGTYTKIWWIPKKRKMSCLQKNCSSSIRARTWMQKPSRIDRTDCKWRAGPSLIFLTRTPSVRCSTIRCAKRTTSSWMNSLGVRIDKLARSRLAA